MHISYSKKFKKRVIEIFPGEYHVVKRKNVILSTLLGSCVSVCLYDPVNSIVGLNHIMISNKVKYGERDLTPDTRYGIHAMEVLINQMIKKGASRKFLKAKVFGGGQVLNQKTDIAYNNVKFAYEYLTAESIKILSKDTGGSHGRKIYLMSKNFTIYLRRIKMSNKLKDTVQKEKALVTKESKKKEDSNLTFF